MDIPQITPPATRSVGTLNSITATPAVAIEQAQDLSFLSVAPTTVDLSTAGRFLSLASLFQKKLLDAQASVDSDTNSPLPIADVAVSATALAAVFNELQTTPVDNNGLPTGSLGEQSLASRFFQQFGGTPEQAEASLAAIGLNVAPFATPFTIDEAQLQRAFEQNPSATTAVLDRAANAFLGAAAPIAPNTVSDANSTAQQARVLVQQLEAEHEAARALDEKIAGASDEVRAALVKDLDQRDAARVERLAVEKATAQRRADQLEQARDEASVPEPQARQTVTVAPSSAPAETATPDETVPPQQPVPPALDQSKLAARDPAIAAAIAAYNLNTGPFAAQNTKPDLQPPKARAVPPVAGVTKVAGVDTLGTAHEGDSGLAAGTSNRG